MFLAEEFLSVGVPVLPFLSPVLIGVADPAVVKVDVVLVFPRRRHMFFLDERRHVGKIELIGIADALDLVALGQHRVIGQSGTYLAVAHLYLTRVRNKLEMFFALE